MIREEVNTINICSFGMDILIGTGVLTRDEARTIIIEEEARVTALYKRLKEKLDE